MIMIIGGASQGKRDYAKKRFPKLSWINGSRCTKEELERAEGIYHFHEYVKRQLEAFLFEAAKLQKEQKPEASELKKIDFEAFEETLAGELLEKNPDLILITDEIGYGIVPIDPFDRAYRETTGRICTRLAAEASEVHRVICGIGARIK